MIEKGMILTVFWRKQKMLFQFLKIFFVSSLLLLLSCKKDNNNSPTSPSSGQFKIIFSSSHFDKKWVILHDLSRGSVRSVRSVNPAGGDVDFGEVGSDHVTFTIVYNDSGHSYLTSFMNVPGGTWDWSQGSAEISGTANIHVSFARGTYSECRFSVPGSSDHYISYPQRDTTEGRWIGEIHQLEDNNRFTVLAALSIGQSFPSDTLTGWLVGQPFRTDTVNHYEILLDQPMQTKLVTTSRAVINLSIDGLRQSRKQSYSLGETNLSGNATIVQARYSLFPCDAYKIRCGNYENTVGFGYSFVSSSIPDHVEIPTGSFNAEWDQASRSFRNINIMGTADALWSWWDSQNQNESISWSIFTPPSASALSLLALPDTIRSQLHGEINQVKGYTLWMLDEDTPSYDSYIMRLAHTTGQPNYSYYYLKDFYGTTSTNNNELPEIFSRGHFDKEKLFHRKPNDE